MIVSYPEFCTLKCKENGIKSKGKVDQHHFINQFIKVNASLKNLIKDAELCRVKVVHPFAADFYACFI